MYWFITYSWEGDSERVLGHDVHKGSVADWLGYALEQPESWILLNQLELTEEQYKKYLFAA